MMYKLRCDLSKTTIHDLCAKYLPEGFQMPPVRSCEFRKYRGSYWLDFTVDPSEDSYPRMNIYFSTWGGNAAMHFHTYNPFDDCPKKRILFVTIPFQSLLEWGFLREVA